MKKWIMFVGNYNKRYNMENLRKECNEEEIYLSYILFGELVFIFVEYHPSYSSVIFPDISNYFTSGKSTNFPLRSMQKVT